jgi:hypothetical protein
MSKVQVREDRQAKFLSELQALVKEIGNSAEDLKVETREWASSTSPRDSFPRF